MFRSFWTGVVSNHPDTCLLDDHDGWIVCSCHGYRWQELASGIAPCSCFYGNCDWDVARPSTMPWRGELSTGNG